MKIIIMLCSCCQVYSAYAFVYNTNQMSAKDSLVTRFLGSADKFTDKQVAETVDMLTEHGVKRGASDIHLEPHDRFILVRYRIDGTLRGIHKLPRVVLGNLMAELKKRASLDVQETQTPQEGDYNILLGNQEIEVHVATMPVYGGEKAVLHLSMQPGNPEDLTTLGFWGDSLATLQSVLARPHGLVVVSGPRHSGISSTLFSLLSQVNSPMVSIATVETRTKHRLPGVNHTYLGKSGLTIAEGLRAALRQDPNVLLLSDIPDRASAELAAHSAATGHLVLAGLHADSAAAAALRLRVAGVEPFLLITAWQAGIGQRLVRRLCPDCRERRELDDFEKQKLRLGFGVSGAAAYKRVYELERAAQAAGLGDSKEFGTTPGEITHLWHPHDGGCEACDHSGYQGRTAIVEVLSKTPSFEKSVMNPDVISASVLQANVLKDGYVPMALDGLIKALRGLTTVDEILRAVAAPPLTK